MATVLRRNHWYSRLIVPRDLQPVIGRCEVLKSLRATRLPDVRLRTATWEGQWQLIFDHVRKAQQTMTPEQLTPYVQRYIAERLAEWEQAWFTGETPAADAQARNEDENGVVEWQDTLAALSNGEPYTTALRHNNLSVAAPAVTDFLSRYQLSITHGSTAYRFVCRELLKAEQAIDKAIRERVQGNYEHAHTPLVAPAAFPTITPPTKLFSEISVVYFIEHKTRQQRTQDMIKSSFARFLDVIGGDRPIGAITKEHCRTFKEGMVQECLAAATITRHLTFLHHFFTWAKGQGYLPESAPDPVKGLKIAKAIQRKEAKRRGLFTPDELRKIFHAPAFLSQRTTHPERYWVILLCLFEGCRREEAGQLDVAQVVTDPTTGVDYLDITDEGEGQGLKNASSKRRVPVHAAVLALGFLEYVAAIRTAGHTRLFPQLTHGANGYADAVGKWFSRHIRQLGITDKGKVLHSFRHAFTTYLHAAGVVDQIVYTLTGHAGSGGGDAHQGYVHRSAFPLPVLREAINKLDYAAVFQACKASISESH